MLGRSFFDMDDDPFFAGHREHMQRMNRMFRDPFEMFGGQQMLDGPRSDRRDDRQVAQRNADPFGMGMFGGFNSMFENMNRMMYDMRGQFEAARNNPDSHVFSQSSVYSYTNTGGEGSRPRVYQASSSVRTGPGGVKETRKAVRDSEKGTEKMAIGHHIHDRAHIIEKSRRGADIEENEELINLGDDEKERFNQEFKDKTREAMRGLEYRRRGERSDRKGIAAPPAREKGYRDRERRDRH